MAHASGRLLYPYPALSCPAKKPDASSWLGSYHPGLQVALGWLISMVACTSYLGIVFHSPFFDHFHLRRNQEELLLICVVQATPTSTLSSSCHSASLSACHPTHRAFPSCPPNALLLGRWGMPANFCALARSGHQWSRYLRSIDRR